MRAGSVVPALSANPSVEAGRFKHVEDDADPPTGAPTIACRGAGPVPTAETPAKR